MLRTPHTHTDERGLARISTGLSMAGGMTLHFHAPVWAKEATHADASSTTHVKQAEGLVVTVVWAAGRIALALQQDMSRHGMVVQSDVGRQVELGDRTFVTSSADAVQARPATRRNRIAAKSRKQRRGTCT